MLPENAVWFVTGCSSGIGAAIATHVVAQGHRLVATARTPSSLHYLPNSPHILRLALDVTDTTSIDTALSTAISHFKRIDVIVNNAGYNAIGIAESLPTSTYRLAMETNFWGPMHITLRAIDIMRSTNPQDGPIGGTIINISSIGGRLALPGEAPYHASKFALEGFTEAVTSEIDPKWNIRIMILEPGGTKSNFTTMSKLNAGPGHEEYNDPGMAVNKMIAALTDPGINEGLVDTSQVARCLFDVLMENEVLPMRLATGADAYALIEKKDTAKMEELRRWRDVSCSVGEAKIPG